MLNATIRQHWYSSANTGSSTFMTDRDTVTFIGLRIISNVATLDKGTFKSPAELIYKQAKKIQPRRLYSYYKHFWQLL